MALHILLYTHSVTYQVCALVCCKLTRWFRWLSGKSPPTAETTPITLSPEDMIEMEKRNELRLKIKEEHLAALQFEGNNQKEGR